MRNVRISFAFSNCNRLVSEVTFTLFSTGGDNESGLTLDCSFSFCPPFTRESGVGGGRQTNSLKGQILAILLLRRGERLHLVLLSLRQLHIISIISNSFYSPLLCILHLVRWPRNPTYSDQQWRDVLQDRVATLFGKVQQSQRAHTITENTKTLHPSSPSLCLIAETSWLLIVSTLKY